jgi:hypothetical protein
MSKLARALGVLAVAATVPLLVAQTASAAVPFNKSVTGKATFYDDQGTSACGKPINAATDRLVAVGPAYWQGGNPNNDPICSGVSVKVKYRNKTMTIPVRDRCAGCDAKHIDLGKEMFRQLTGNLDLGHAQVTWEFVRS